MVLFSLSLFEFFAYINKLKKCIIIFIPKSLNTPEVCVTYNITVMSESDQVNGLPEDPTTWPELKLPELLHSDAVREVHATIEKEWDFLQRSACQTAAGRALWKHVIHDPLADLLAGESYLRNLHEKITKDRLNNAREISGVILAVRTLWFDSRIEDTLNSTNGREAQVVLLGAGFYTLQSSILFSLFLFLI